MELTIVVPILNEYNYINDLVDSLLSDDGFSKEIYLVDGGSDDGTVDLIKDLEIKHKNIHYLHNRDKYVSHAFNLALVKSKGKFIALVGAHSILSKNYFKKAVFELNSNSCDAVGGIFTQIGKDEYSSIIAKCLSSKFGVGNSQPKLIKSRTYVKSAAFAVYKRKIFEVIGGFDEDLIRNQDDEFHYRLVSKGYKMLLDPMMEATCFTRNNLKALFSQYFQYGYYKPLVFKKVPSGISLSHFIPFLFVLYLFLFFVSIFFDLIIITMIPLVLYNFINIYYSNFNSNKLKGKIYSILVYYSIHIAYGLGFLIGLTKKNIYA